MAELKESFTSGLDTWYKTINTPRYDGQTWTTTSSYDLEFMKIKMRRTGSPGTMTFEVYATSAGKPTGSVLATGTVNANLITTDTAGEWVTLAFTTPYTVADATMYAFVYKYSACDASNFIEHHTDTDNGYAGGTYVYSTNGGSSWVAYGGADQGFEAWAESDSPPLEITISGEGSLTVEDLLIAVDTDAEVSGDGSIVLDYTATNVNNLGHLMVTPIIAIQPGQDVGADQGSADIWNNVVPIVRPTLFSGDHEQNEPSPMDQNDFTGTGPIRGHEVPWFEIAHLLPRLVQDVGNLSSEQIINCELYNADRTNQITVNFITNNLGVGFIVEGVPPTPFNIATQDSLSFTIRVLQSGDLIIDGEYTLTLSTGEEYTISIIGSRIVLLPLRPEAPLREHLVWETKILSSIDVGEQRIANRATPRSVFEFTLKEGRKTAETILFDRQSKLLAVPAWHEPSFLTSAGNIGDYTIYVDTTEYGNFYVGGYAIIFTDKYTFDALKIASKTTTSITFESPLAANHAKDTQVMPLMSAFVEATTPMVKAVYNDQDIQLKLLVHATPNDIASTTAWNSYNGKVLMDEPNYIPSRQIREAFRTKIYVLDNLSGDRGQFAQQIRALRHSQKGFKTNSRQELWELRQLLHALKGRQVSFYIPTFSKDLVPNTTLLQSNSTLTMDNIGYTLNVDERWPRQVFRLHLKNGTILTRTIVGSSELSNSVEQLTVDIVWPYDILVTDIERIEFLEKVRFDTDDIMIIHYNACGMAECVVPTVEVTDDDV